MENLSERKEFTDKPYQTFGLFNDSFPPIMDGVALAVKNYADWLYQAGYPVCVVTPNVPNYTDREPYPVYRYTSVPIPVRRPYRLGLPDLDISIHERYRKQRFELVHAHCPFSSGIMALRTARDQGVPFVATFHTKYRDDFERATHSRQLANLMIKEVIWFYEKADEVWVPQAAVEETLREYGYKGKVEIVENGNDFATDQELAPIKREARVNLGISPDEIVFLFVGQHVWEKNTRMIIKSLALIRDLPFKMFFVGTGYAAEEMKSLVAELGLTDKVVFTGMLTDREQLKQYYAASDLFIFPSIYDNAPLVVREAGALGTPTVMVSGSTAAEILTDNVNGFLIDNTPEALAARLRELYSDRERMKDVGLSASKTIARSWKDIVNEEVLDRYMSLIKRKQKKNAASGITI